jgi:starvation-inducible DNA-binding protein
MLVDDLKTLLATQYAFVIKAQNFHWNVEGPDFHSCMNFLETSIKKFTLTA